MPDHLAPAPSELPPGTEVAGRFRLGECLGSGPGYTAYAGHEVASGARLLLRVFEPAEFDPPLSLPALQAALSRLRTANLQGIISGAECGCDGNLLWLARRWLEGLPLTELLRSRGALSLRDACALLSTVAAACDEAAAAGLIGLDLSPRPMLLQAGDGTEPVPASLVRAPLREWPACRLALEALYGVPREAPGPGNYFFRPGDPRSLRLLVALFCDFLGRAGVDPAGASAPILSSLDEGGNELLAQAWKGGFRSHAEFADRLREQQCPSSASASGYHPEPVDLSAIELPPQLVALGETIAEHIHDTWAARRLAEGWRYGPARDDRRREHPCLVPYDALSESEKAYDRATSINTLRAILAFGFRLEPPPE